MADPQPKVRDVAWSELFPWLMLLRSVRIALMARVLVLGAAGILATMVGWMVLIEVFPRGNDPVISAWRPETGLTMWTEQPSAVTPSWVNTSARSVGEVFESASSYLVRTILGGL